MRALAVLVCALALPGCAHDLAHASAGAIGCSPPEITISEVSMSWSTTSWRARCRGVEFRCAGEGAPSCAPELAPVVAPSMAVAAVRETHAQ
ncbi:MAG: hypothetical protein IPK74_39410 [Deltaproteobacteria bacterium]|nr:hypothetical protein [Deltaproteobacteria bacterium]